MSVHDSPSPSHSPSASPLDNLHIASPCHASWDAMSGDDRARFCRTCQKNVFNISLMTRTEAEALIREKEGNLCVRFARREDGTILTNDCPVGWERARNAALRPWRFVAAGVAAVVVALVSALGGTPQVAAQPTLDQNSEATSDASINPSGDAIEQTEQPAVQPTATPLPTATPQPRQHPPMLMGTPAAAPIMMGEPAAVPATTPPACTLEMGGPSTGPQPPVMGKPAMPSPTPAPTYRMGRIMPPLLGQPVALPTPSKTVKNAAKPVRGKNGARR